MAVIKNILAVHKAVRDEDATEAHHMLEDGGGAYKGESVVGTEQSGRRMKWGGIGRCTR